MISLKLQYLILIALVSAAVGSGITYVAVPSNNSETNALLRRQLEIAEKEEARKEAAAEKRKQFFSAPGAPPTSGEQKMAPRFD